MQQVFDMGYIPGLWTWHPYGDVDASWNGSYNTQQTQDSAYYINNFYTAVAPQFAKPDFWLTEAGVRLPSSSYPQVNGNPTAQANAAEGFLHLQGAPNQAFSGQIQRVYWYEFQTDGDGVHVGSDSWDSALLGIDQPDWVDDGTGVPRASYCVLAYGDSPATAATDARCDYAENVGGPNEVPWTDWEDCFSSCVAAPAGSNVVNPAASSSYAAALQHVFGNTSPQSPASPPSEASLVRPHAPFVIPAALTP